jgi:hypothetical protein
VTTESLESLAAEAGALDAAADAAAPVAAAEPEAPAADVPAEVAALLKTVTGMLTPAFPCLAEIYTDATCRALGEAAAPVMAKYGVSVGGIFDRWGAEITLAAVALPVGAATWKGVKAELAAGKATPDKVSAPVAPAAEKIPAGALVIPSPGAS